MNKTNYEKIFYSAAIINRNIFKFIARKRLQTLKKNLSTHYEISITDEFQQMKLKHLKLTQYLGDNTYRIKPYTCRIRKKVFFNVNKEIIGNDLFYLYFFDSNGIVINSIDLPCILYNENTCRFELPCYVTTEGDIDNEESDRNIRPEHKRTESINNNLSNTQTTEKEIKITNYQDYENSTNKSLIVKKAASNRSFAYSSEMQNETRQILKLPYIVDRVIFILISILTFFLVLIKLSIDGLFTIKEKLKLF